MSVVKFERYFTRDEERRLFATIRRCNTLEARRDYHWMRLMRYTGMRVGSMAQLTCGDARQSLQTFRLVLRDDISKNKNGYDLKLTVKAQAAVLELLRVRRKMGAIEDPNEPLVITRQGRKGMSCRTYQERMKHWSKLIGIPQATPHWWRHTFAKRVEETSTHKNVMKVLTAVLGHTNPYSAYRYALPDKEALDQAMDAAQ